MSQVRTLTHEIRIRNKFGVESSTKTHVVVFEYNENLTIRDIIARIAELENVQKPELEMVADVETNDCRILVYKDPSDDATWVAIIGNGYIEISAPYGYAYCVDFLAHCFYFYLTYH